eukprot:4635937-Pleurochrysis_carterae.AAC.1
MAVFFTKQLPQQPLFSLRDKENKCRSLVIARHPRTGPVCHYILPSFSRTHALAIGATARPRTLSPPRHRAISRLAHWTQQLQLRTCKLHASPWVGAHRKASI